MAFLNRVEVIGNLTQDPETRFTPNGAQVMTFTLGVNRRWKDQSGEWQEESLFIHVNVWGKTAEKLGEARCLEKGTQVYVEGRLSQRSWETQDGQKKSVTEITASPFMVIPIQKLNYNNSEPVKEPKKSEEKTSPVKEKTPEPQKEPIKESSTDSGEINELFN